MCMIWWHTPRISALKSVKAEGSGGHSRLHSKLEVRLGYMKTMSHRREDKRKGRKRKGKKGNEGMNFLCLCHEVCYVPLASNTA